jgi:hypothetical protein
VAAHLVTILRRDLIIATTLFGLGIWIVNFYFFSPLLFPLFETSFVAVQFIAHTLCYGMTLGVILLELMPPYGVRASDSGPSRQAARPGPRSAPPI